MDGTNHEFAYRCLEEPDWRRLPGFRNVSRRDWESSRWQRLHSARNVSHLREVFGDFLPPELAGDIEADQRERATMPLLIPPQMLNTMGEQNLCGDPVRRYMAPALSDRDPVWPSHPLASRDPLAESAMWPVEGLIHRYPAKALIECTSTCPQYCGHCTRMDLVGTTTAQVSKYRFAARPRDRLAAALEYLRRTPQIRDVVVSGGDIANMPIGQLVAFVEAVIAIPSIRHVRLATKSLIALPQYYLADEVRRAMRPLGEHARRHGVALAVHTHANHANQITPLVARAATQFLDWGFRAVRNQGVLMRGVNDTPSELLRLCLSLDEAGITPYYFFMCDMVPGSEHWRTPLWQAQELQHSLMGQLPGYATPRVVCDVPLAGKLWVHQVDLYERERGISHWSKRYRTTIEREDPEADLRSYRYYDPIDTLPEAGRAWWQEHIEVAAAEVTESTPSA